VNRAILAVAGSRKTQSIVDACANSTDQRRRLVLTYTTSAQNDVEARLRQACTAQQLPDVSGWYTFLLHHWVRPYLPLLYPGRRLAGLNFDEKSGIDYATGAARHLDTESRAYKRYLSKLAIDVAAAASGGSVIDRLERIYDEIHVDEVQDLTGYDLDILEMLLKSKVAMRLVGDVRQSTFSTNPQDQRHKKYRDLKMLDWFKLQERKGRLELQFSNTTWRCNQQIASLSDTIFDAAHGFPPTVSEQAATSDHDGIFLVPAEHLLAYVEKFDPLCLRQTAATRTPDHLHVINFGVAKGLTCERVLVFPTGPIRDFLVRSKPLTGKSACGFYVAVTRAIHSVAFVVDSSAAARLPVWTPQQATE
jgi:DNA helicase II / ATP-dependent DNA helicase PcrA